MTSSKMAAHGHAPALTHWRLERDAGGVAWLTFDQAGSTANTFSEETLAELNQVLDHLDAHPPAGLIVESGKARSFIVGADIHAMTGLTHTDQIHAFIQQGARTFDRVAALPYPSLALIAGSCLGGGLEFALACTRRVVVDLPDTRLGLPEVMLGIVPGWGGMHRLPDTIGAPLALDLMLSSRTLDAHRAVRSGLADLKVAARVARQSARAHVLTRRPANRARGLPRLLNARPLRALVAARARKTVQARDPYGHYAAPRAIIDIWLRYDGDPLRAPQIVDALFASDTAHNLVRVFHLQERLKSFGRVRGETDVAHTSQQMPQQASQHMPPHTSQQVPPHTSQHIPQQVPQHASQHIPPHAPPRTSLHATVRHVHVIGAGVMGGDIAAWCAFKGLTVTLNDSDAGRIAKAQSRAQKLFSRRLRDSLQARAAFDRLIPDPDGHGIARADLVLEAIAEDADAKRALYREIEPRMRIDAVLATNTSSLQLSELFPALRLPQRLVGVHFFNPVARLPLVEVVSSAMSGAAYLNRAFAWVGNLGKLALPVRDVPGFLVNAVLAPYMHEAIRCVDEGMAPEAVDEAMLAFGMPMGPIELADKVGLDVVRAAGEQLVRQGEAPEVLTRLIGQGDLGEKTGKGFYPWRDGRAQKNGKGRRDDALAQRLLAPLRAQAQAQLAAGVVDDADLVDAGMIFGAGFAPFTGGPLHHQI